MKLYVKNMVSMRCKMVLNDALTTLGIKYSTLELGCVDTVVNISDELRRALSLLLSEYGLVLMEDINYELTKRIKTVIIEMINGEMNRSIKYSAYISKVLNFNYAYLSNIFHQYEGITVQQFIINEKIEKVKELLTQGAFSLTDISFMLNYCSVAHLSRQFKNVTGFCPSYFKHNYLKKLVPKYIQGTK